MPALRATKEQQWTKWWSNELALRLDAFISKPKTDTESILLMQIDAYIDQNGVRQSCSIHEELISKCSHEHLSKTHDTAYAAWWIKHLNDLLQNFISDPRERTISSLVGYIESYKDAVECGRVVPPSINHH